MQKVILPKYGKRWRWHDIRGSFITHVALTSGPVQAQSLARHSDYATTATYVEVSDEFRREAAHRAADRPALAWSVAPTESPPSAPAPARGGRALRAVNGRP